MSSVKTPTGKIRFPTVFGSTVTVGTVVHSYLIASGRGKSQGWALKQIMDRLSTIPVAGLNHQVITTYETVRRHKDMVAESTVRRELGALRTALGWGLRAGIIPTVPWFTLPNEAPARGVFLSDLQENYVFTEARSCAFQPGYRFQRIGLFVCIALETAARTRDIERLEWSQVQTSPSNVDFIDFRKPGERVNPKKKKGAVPISNRLGRVLTAAASAPVSLSSPFVLGSDGSTRHEWEAFREYLIRNSGGLRIPGDLRRHDLRRTWASLAVMRGVSIFDVAKVLHDTVETTEKHYAHLAPNYLQGVMNQKNLPPQPQAGTP